MPVKLVDRKSTYEFVLKIDGEKEEDFPIFTMRYLSSEEVGRIEDQLVVTRNDNQMGYLTGTGTLEKIKAAVVSWKKIYTADGQPVEATEQAKRDLPSSVSMALVEHIDEVNGLNKSKGRKAYEKN